MRFRPCIDLHRGVVKQIVGATLGDDEAEPSTNFRAEEPPAHFASLYRRDRLFGGHVIMLGPGNEQAAREALAAFPGGMQVGGGITAENAQRWLDAGASAVIVTSFVFRDGKIDAGRLDRLSASVPRDRLVLDLSCRQRDGAYWIATDRWTRFSDEQISPELLDRLAGRAAEFLVHGVDVEGRCSGIEGPLVELIGRWAGIPITYAGGIRGQEDIDRVESLGRGRIDFTVGSALDLFGGPIPYRQLAAKYGE